MIEFSKALTDVSFSPSQNGEPFDASVSVVLWKSVLLPNFRIISNGAGPAVIWTEAGPDGKRVSARPPENLPWGLACEAILEAYRRDGHR